MRRESVIEELKEHLERVRRGWVNGTPERRGEVCLLYERTSYHHLRNALSAPAERWIQKIGAEQYPEVGVIRDAQSGALVWNGVKWNDSPGRTQAEVEALLEKAIMQAGGSL